MRKGVVFGDPLCQQVHANSPAVVTGHEAEILGREAGQHGGLGHRMVDLIRGVESPPQEVVGQQLSAGRDHRREVGERPPRGENAQRLFGVAHHAAEPPDDVGLELDQTRCGRPHPDIAIDRVGDEVGDGRLKETTAGDVGEIPRPGGVEGLVDELAKEPFEQVGIGLSLLGGGFDQRPGQLLPALGVEGGLLGE